MCYFPGGQSGSAFFKAGFQSLSLKVTRILLVKIVARKVFLFDLFLSFNTFSGNIKVGRNMKNPIMFSKE